MSPTVLRIRSRVNRDRVVKSDWAGMGNHRDPYTGEMVYAINTPRAVQNGTAPYPFSVADSINGNLRFS